MSDNRIKIIDATPARENQLVRTPAGAVRTGPDMTIVTTQAGDKYPCLTKDVVKLYELLPVGERVVVKPQVEKSAPQPDVNEKNDKNRERERAKKVKAKEAPKEKGPRKGIFGFGGGS